MAQSPVRGGEEDVFVRANLTPDLQKKRVGNSPTRFFPVHLKRY